MPVSHAVGSLTEKQILFAEEYVLNGGNGTAACRSAEYSDKSTNALSSQAWENLRNPKVTAYIAQLRKEIAADFKVTAEEVIGGLRHCRDRALQVEEVYDEKGNPTGTFVCDIPSAIRSIELLGKTVGIFIDKSEIGLNIEDLANLIVRQKEEMRADGKAGEMETEDDSDKG